MAYRAPELFDVKTGVTLDEKVDIWVDLPVAVHAFANASQSLGCTLFALAYSHSPFENIQTTEQGGSIAMAVLNAQYKHPNSAYSQGLKDLIDSMLKVNPKDRPNIHQVCVSGRSISVAERIPLGHYNDRQSTTVAVVEHYILYLHDWDCVPLLVYLAALCISNGIIVTWTDRYILPAYSRSPSCCPFFLTRRLRFSERFLLQPFWRLRWSRGGCDLILLHLALFLLRFR